MNSKIFFWSFYFISVVFVLAGAINNGFSLYFMAVPFMLYMIWLSKFKFQKNILFYISIFIIFSAIIINHTQTKNPILYPILSDGYVEILQDGYHVKYSDGSGGFILYEYKNKGGCIGCGKAEYLELKKGDRYKVTGVKISHPDFGTNIDLITEIGQFDESDYDIVQPLQDRHISINKTAYSDLAKKLSMLMAWPVIPLEMSSFIENIPRYLLLNL